MIIIEISISDCLISDGFAIHSQRGENCRHVCIYINTYKYIKYTHSTVYVLLVTTDKYIVCNLLYCMGCNKRKYLFTFTLNFSPCIVLL